MGVKTEVLSTVASAINNNTTEEVVTVRIITIIVKEIVTSIAKGAREAAGIHLTINKTVLTDRKGTISHSRCSNTTATIKEVDIITIGELSSKMAIKVVIISNTGSKGIAVVKVVATVAGRSTTAGILGEKVTETRTWPLAITGIDSSSTLSIQAGAITREVSERLRSHSTSRRGVTLHRFAICSTMTERRDIGLRALAVALR